METFCVKTSPYFFKWKFTEATSENLNFRSEGLRDLEYVERGLLSFVKNKHTEFLLDKRRLLIFSFFYLDYTRETRLPRMTCKAANRWHLAVTLLRNPSLIKYRKQGGQKVLSFVNLASINNDDSALV